MGIVLNFNCLSKTRAVEHSPFSFSKIESTEIIRTSRTKAYLLLGQFSSQAFAMFIRQVIDIADRAGLQVLFILSEHALVLCV